jgi:6-phosphogluconolactonase
MNNREIIVCHTIEALAAHVAGILKEETAMITEGSFYTVALSGGDTPKKIFRIISQREHKTIDWDRIRFFWGDERCVPPDNDESNYHMAQQYLLKDLNIPEKNIFRIHGEAVPEHEVIRYGRIITANVQLHDGIPRFNLIMLGLGADGHTASIFPDHVHVFHSRRYYDVTLQPRTDQKRITMTGRIINNAHHVIFMITGPAKADMVSKIVRGKSDPLYPASLVKPSNGILTWLLDEEAAGLLVKDTKLELHYK